VTKRISRTLFDPLAIGTRLSFTRVVSEECSWWSDLDGQVLGAVVFDKTDQDYGWIMLIRDLAGRFRCVDLEVSLPSERIATARLRLAIAEKTRDKAFHGSEAQGGEPNYVLDLFENRGVPDNKLHKYYREVRDNVSRSPAKKVLQAISPWLVTSDAHLVKEFQEAHFDQRLWEIYLWAMFRDQGYDVKHHEAPDLIVTSPWFAFSVEATTVAPSTAGPLAIHPNPSSPEEMQDFIKHYMPMKFGSSLVSKLNKTDAQGRRYWELPGAENLPFVFAIADFHKEADGATPASMTYSQGGLYVYLFGNRASVNFENGKLVIRNEPVPLHTYKGKTVPSGFFDLPGAENVSAVLFSNAGTISKFERLGVLAGFAPPEHKYIRKGHLFDPNPDAYVGLPFSIDISDPDYEEFWGDEVQVFHNPRALRPLSPEAFPDAANFLYEQGKVVTFDRPGRVLSSLTMILRTTQEG
jgi:hypothetical protein